MPAGKHNNAHARKQIQLAIKNQHTQSRRSSITVFDKLFARLLQTKPKDQQLSHLATNGKTCSDLIKLPVPTCKTPNTLFN